MKTLILGGTGFIGTALCRALLSRGDTVVTPSRSPGRHAPLGAQHTLPFWDGQSPEGLRPLLDDVDAVVNLVGENIAGARWNDEVRQRILQSRIRAGDCLTQAWRTAAAPPKTLIQASASGYYGTWSTPHAAGLDERTPPGTSFLASVCVAWEASTQEVEALGARRCVLRTSPVLGHGGLLAKLLPVFRLGLGGPVGSGTQPFSWIQLDDEVRAVLHVLDDAACRGPFNLCGPERLDMNAFARTLGQVLHRPAWLRVPAFAVRLALGQMAEELILTGQPVRPAQLEASGFVFRFPTLRQALEVSV